MEIVPLGDSALAVRVGDSLGEILEVLRRLESAKIPGVIDLAPAFASVAVFLDSPEFFDVACEKIRLALQGKKRGASATKKPRLIEVPVCYDPEFGVDLERVAQHCRISPNEAIALHSAAAYNVRCVGFTPGFPYLSGLPAKLATPRRMTPRAKIPAGAVAIGGAQSGIYPQASPGGWNIIGRTPLRLFEVTRDEAALLRTGDCVRFCPIDRATFEQWEK